MLKKYSSLIIFSISFICFYLSTIFGVEYLNVVFIFMFIYIYKKYINKISDNKFMENFKKYNLLMAILLLVIFLILRLVFKADKIYYDVFLSLILSIAILRGAI